MFIVTAPWLSYVLLDGAGGVEVTDTSAAPAPAGAALVGLAPEPLLLLLLLHAASRAAAAAAAPTIASRVCALNMGTSEMQLLPIDTRPGRPRFTLRPRQAALLRIGHFGSWSGP